MSTAFDTSNKNFEQSQGSGFKMDDLKHINGNDKPIDELTNVLGRKIEITGQLLGKGAYGSVYSAKDENGKQLAVKCCAVKKYGIENIVESSIMTSIIHPNLNRGLGIYPTEKKLYILQEKAKCDLSKYTKNIQNRNTFEINRIKKWLFSISSAVMALHKNKIIHADIKSSNVLLFEDDNVKLCDFTLSMVKTQKKQKFLHMVCTCTHRPLECFLRKGWDESLDIWSLGCTFYEVFYGNYLFNYQGNRSKEKDNIPEIIKSYKIKKKNRSINALIDWAINGPCGGKNFSFLEQQKRKGPYRKFNWPPKTNNFPTNQIQLFNDLLLKMLAPDSSKRLSIKQVLSHDFFSKFEIPKSILVQRTIVSQHFESDFDTDFILFLKEEPKIFSYARNIYIRYNHCQDVSKYLVLISCYFIAIKILFGHNQISEKINNFLSSEHCRFKIDQITLAERLICRNTNFHLLGFN